MSARQIQKWLFEYLSIDIDPFDFSYCIPEWAAASGLEFGAETYAESLTAQQLRDFERWLRSSAKMAEVLEQDPVESPAYLTLHARQEMPEGTWLIHFSRSPFKVFDRGTTLRGMHLSTWKREREYVDCKRNLKGGIFESVFGFAYEAETRRTHSLIRMGSQYGDYCVLFQCDAGVLAYHDGDAEDQVIFPLCSEYNAHRFSIDGGLLGEVKGGKSITFDSVAEAIGYIETSRRPRLQGYEQEHT